MCEGRKILTRSGSRMRNRRRGTRKIINEMRKEHSVFQADSSDRSPSLLTIFWATEFRVLQSASILRVDRRGSDWRWHSTNSGFPAPERRRFGRWCRPRRGKGCSGDRAPWDHPGKGSDGSRREGVGHEKQCPSQSGYPPSEQGPLVFAHGVRCTDRRLRTTSWGGCSDRRTVQGFVEIEVVDVSASFFVEELERRAGLTAGWRREPSLCRDSPPR